MSTSTVTGTSAAVKAEFASANLLANAAIYRANKRIVDAASGYDSLDDAMAGLTDAWDALEGQIKSGGGYTPDVGQGFGSDNAAVIAESLLGRRNGVGATRKAFSNLGK